MQKIWNSLSNLSLIQWTVGAVITVILGWGIYFWRYLKSQFRFGKNLKRKIYFLRIASSQNLQTEKDNIKKFGLFNVEEDIKDISKDLKILQNLEKSAVYIIGYDSNYQNYTNLIDEAKSKKIPIIIFAKQGEIKEHWKVFNSYINCDVANTTSRLAVILLNILKIV